MVLNKGVAMRFGLLAPGGDGRHRRLRDRLSGIRLKPHGVFAQQFNATGVARGSIFRVNTPQADNQGAPAIAMDAAGDFVIAWEDGGPSASRSARGSLRPAVHYNAGSGGPREQHRNQHGRQRGHPSVAMEPTGQYGVCLAIHAVAPHVPGIEAQRFDTHRVPQWRFFSSHC